MARKMGFAGLIRAFGQLTVPLYNKYLKAPSAGRLPQFQHVKTTINYRPQSQPPSGGFPLFGFSLILRMRIRSNRTAAYLKWLKPNGEKARKRGYKCRCYAALATRRQRRA
jgi:hypothetical protein